MCRKAQLEFERSNNARLDEFAELQSGAGYLRGPD